MGFALPILGLRRPHEVIFGVIELSLLNFAMILMIQAMLI